MSGDSIMRIALVWLVSVSAMAAELTQAEKEAFLRNARIVKKWHTPRGVANPWQAILDDGTMQHDAHIQTVDVRKDTHQTARGVEFDFRDSYKYNIAAYELAKILELDMVPPSVERKVTGQDAAVTWWVDNKKFDEVDRILRKIEPADREGWEKQMHVVRVFDQLICNTDRNRGNLVITNDWQVFMIDHTRAFRKNHDLLDAKSLGQCDRRLLAKLRELSRPVLTEHLGKHLTGPEIDGIWARREKIVKFFDDELARKGPERVLFDLAGVRK